jgi:hypothetical protein
MVKRDSGTYRLLVMTGVLTLGLFAGFVAGRRTGPGSGAVPWLGEEKTMTGPWGEIRYWHSLLETPAALLTEWTGSAGKSTMWFVGLTKKETGRLLDECEMTPTMRDTLLATAKEEPDGGVRLYPSDEFVISIPPDLRSRLYARLIKWPENKTVGTPARFMKESKLDWLDESNLPSEVIQLTKKLIYERNGIQLFANYDIVLRTISDHRTARRFLRVMCRRTTIMGVLVVRPEDDIEALTRYWGRGGREAEVRTLLEAARLSDGSHEVPLVSLLPPFVKDHLYRYQNNTDPETATCHYTSFNFFSTQPDKRFAELSFCSDVISRDYAAVTNDFQLGDVVMMMFDDGEIIHSCTVIAGDLVFTKNGRGKGQPWMIQTLDRLSLFYTAENPLAVKVLRRSDLF